MGIREDFVRRAERFCADHNIPETELGMKAIGKYGADVVIRKTRQGENVTLHTLEKIERYMELTEQQLSSQD